MKRWGLMAGACALAVGLAGAASAQTVPQTVTFTARIADNGVAATGQHDLGFALFSGPTGGAAVWQEGPLSFTVTDGLIYHELGSSTSLDDTILGGGKVYLELTVDGTILTPRVAIVSVPYAIRAGVAGEADSLSGMTAGDFITGVTAGAGLTGGGSTGDVSLGVTFGGSGTASTVARSDHNHTGTYLPLGSTLACTPGDFVSQVLASGNLVCTTPSAAGGDLTPDTIADDGVIVLGSETMGAYDATADTIADDGTITLGSETTGAYDATADTIADDGTITLGTETTGAYDATADTICDDGVIDDLEASNNLSIDNGRLFAPGGAGPVGIGTTTPLGGLQVSASGNINNSCGGTFRTAENAIAFRNDPGGGCGDQAWIGYRVRGTTGEATDLEIVNQNDVEDNIVLNAAGNVGVNTLVPVGGKLVVSANPSGTVLNDGFEDSTLAPFVGSGSASWLTATGVAGTPEGTVTGRSGVIANGQSSTMTYTSTSVDAAVVTFWWRVSSEAGYDFLRFYVDGVQQLASAGDSGWQQSSFVISAGTHTLTWTYSKDPVCCVMGDDAAYVDQVQILNYGANTALTTNGRVGVGTATPLDMLQVAGDVRIGTGTTGCLKDADATVIAGTCSSDARLKTNIAPFAPMLDRVAQLQPVEYDWRTQEFPDRHFGDKRSWGLIAQDVEKLFPDMVVEDAAGYKAVNYSKLPLMLLEALKEEHAKLAAEHARNDRLEADLADLRHRLDVALPSTAPRAGRSPVLPMALGAAGALALALAAAALRRRRRD